MSFLSERSKQTISEEERWKTVTKRERDNRQMERRTPSYVNKPGSRPRLSPTKSYKSNRDRDSYVRTDSRAYVNRHRKDRKTYTEKENYNENRTNSSEWSNPRLPWKNLSNLPTPDPSDEEFPALRNTEPKKPKPTDWGTLAEEYDRQVEKTRKQIESYKRKVRRSFSENEESETKKGKYQQSAKQNCPMPDLETDESVLIRRSKQVQYGKNTDGYQRYSSLVKREDRTKAHPKTPNKFVKYSRRAWDTQIRNWRKLLHCWDPPHLASQNSIGESFNDTASEGSLEVSNTEMIVESSLENINDIGTEPGVSTPDNSQQDETLLVEDLMEFAISPVVHNKGQSSSNHFIGQGKLRSQRAVMSDYDADEDDEAILVDIGSDLDEFSD